MRHIIFQLAADSKYPVALLIKGAAFNQHALQTNYIDPLKSLGVSPDKVIAFTLDYNADNKAPAKLIKAYLESLLPAVNSLGVQYLYCADGNYFKTLTKKTKAEPHVGYALPCAIEGYEHIQVVLGLKSTDRFFRTSDEQKREPATLEFRSIPGMEAVYGRWIVRGAGPYTVTVVSPKGGRAERTSEPPK